MTKSIASDRLAAEHLMSDDGLEVNAETLRRWMLAEGLWSRERKRKPYRQRRERRKQFGELVQFDGSPHDWFEGRGPKCMLMNMVDDATSTSEAIFSEQETIWAAATVLRKWVTTHGIPGALYTDWKNIYKQKVTAGQQLRGENPTTQFGRMCSKLGIRIIAANSAQAKGRVERNHGTHQDRMIKKMRLKGIGSIEEGNRFLSGYLAEHNRRFTSTPAEAVDYHVRLPKDLDLDNVFRLETMHTVGNDWVVQHKGLLFQIQPQSRHYAPARGKVMVCEWQDGRMKIYYRDREIRWEQISERPARLVKPTTSPRHRQPERPAADHPWKQSFKDMKPRNTERQIK